MSKRPAKPRARKRALLVANPAAQSGRNEDRIAVARELLDRAAIAHEFLATLPEGRTAAAVAAALKEGGCSLAIAMGGDGTLSEVARGLVDARLARKIPLGVLPTGTANDVGRSFGLGASEAALERNVDVLRAGHETDLDAARLSLLDDAGAASREHLFVDSAGWGMIPHALRMRNADRRIVEGIPIVREVYRDHLLYATSLFKALGETYLTDVKFDVDVLADGERLTWKNLTDLVVKNQRLWAGLWVLDPDSRHDDGLLDVIPFAGRRDFLSKALMYLDPTGSLSKDLAEAGLDHLPGLRAARLELTFRPRRAGRGLLDAQVDGEEFPSARRVRVEALPRALRLIIPHPEGTRAP